MNEKIKSWVIVAPEAPEWMRKVAKTLSEAGEDAHGAILAICGDKYTSVHCERISVADIAAVIGSLADTVREQVGNVAGNVLVQEAIKEDGGK